MLKIGIEEVVLPLVDSAVRLASVLQLKGVLSLNEISNEHAVAEIMVPASYFGHLPETIDLEERYKIKVIAIKRVPKEGILNSVFKRDYQTDLFYSNTIPFVQSDILVIAGRVSDIKSFIGS